MIAPSIDPALPAPRHEESCVGVARRTVLPVLRLVVWAVIAVALVKIAFTGADVTADDALVPTGEVVEPTVEVAVGTITNSVVVPAAVVADPAVSVRATAAGTVSALHAADGARVDAGAAILDVRQEIPRDPVVTTDPVTGAQTVTERRPRVVVETVRSPVAGTLTLPTLKDQVVAVGETVGTVAPGTLSVSGTLTPDQQYRLLDAPAEGTVTLKGGPAPFTCTGLSIGAAAPTPNGTAGGEPSPSGAVTCAIPAGVTAFAGLGADLEILNGSAEDAVLVPVTAVQGSVQNGNVWVVAGADRPEERAVRLGLTDGEHVQVVDGLAVGDTVLQFVPVAGGSRGDVDCADPAGADPALCLG